MSAGGREFLAGDVDVPFTVMSVAKPFVFALACELLGIDPGRARVLAAQRLSRALGLDLFASPVVAAPADDLTR